MKKFSRRRILAAGTAAISVAAIGCDTSNADSGSTPAPVSSAVEKVSLVLDWTPNTNHTGIYVAEALGYFANEGIELTIIEPATTGAESVVASGKADFGISFQDYLTPARLEGLPIVSVAAIMGTNTSGFASLKSKNLTSPKAFEGKTYGGLGTELETAMLKTMMEMDGGDFSKLDVVDAGAGDFLSLIQGDIDLYWIFFGWQGIKAQVEEVEINTVFVSDWGVPDYYTPIIISNEDTLSQRSEAVTKTLSAITKGYNYCIALPDQAAEILVSAVPEIDINVAKPSQEWLSRRYVSMNAMWGEQDPEIWETMSKWMAEKGLVSSVIEWDKAFTNKFLTHSTTFLAD